MSCCLYNALQLREVCVLYFGELWDHAEGRVRVRVGRGVRVEV